MVCKGDLAYISDDYPRGVWLSGWSVGGKNPVVGYVPCGEIVVVIEFDDGSDSVLVASRGGVMGWTWMNRLEVL